MEQVLIMQENSASVIQPITIKDVLLLSPGRWNDVDYTELEIKKAFNNTNWNDRKFTSLYLDHQDTKEHGVANWVGYVQNIRVLNNEMRGDLEIWNPLVGIYLKHAKAKFGISATLAGRENKRLSRMEDFHFESFSIVTDPACKPALINLSQNSDETIKTIVNENTVLLESEKHRERREDIESVGDKKDFQSALKARIQDEKHAPEEYENLKSLTDDEELKKQIDSIIADERKHYDILNKFGAKELANEGSVSEGHALEPVKYDKPKEKEELDAKFERQVQHIKDSLKKSHPEWTEEKIKQVAYATANKLKENNFELKDVDEIVVLEELAQVTAFEEVRKEKGMSPSEFYAMPREPPSSSSLPIFDAAHVRNAIARFNQTHLSPSEKTHAWSAIERAAKKFGVEVTSEKENSDANFVKGGRNMPEMENESKMELESLNLKVQQLEAALKSKDAEIEELKKSMKKEEPKEEPKKEEPKKEEPKDTESPKAEKAEEDKEDKEKLSETILNKVKEMLEAKISSLQTTKLQEMETKVKELEAKTKIPARKTLSVAFDSASAADSNIGMLGFLNSRLG